MSVTLEFATVFDDSAIAELSRRNPGYRFERDWRGKLIVSPTGSQGGARNAALTGQLWNWSERTKLGEVFDSSTGFRLPDGSLLSPDAAWVARDWWERLSASERKGYAPLCPDAIFEIRSESDAQYDFEAKGRDYARNGAKLVVLIDPIERCVSLFRDNRLEQVSVVSAVSLDPGLTGFTLDVERLFL